MRTRGILIMTVACFMAMLPLSASAEETAAPEKTAEPIETAAPAGTGVRTELEKDLIEQEPEKHYNNHLNNSLEIDQIYKFPAIKPSYTFYGGMKVQSISGSSQVDEYGYNEADHSLSTFGFRFVEFPFPHRVHLEIDFPDDHDNYWDFSYAYKDTLLTRLRRNTLYHNLENIRLTGLGDDPRYRVEQRDSGEVYALTATLDSYGIRYKVHEFPLHFFVEGNSLNRDGKVQERYLGGSGYYNNLRVVSVSRDVDNSSDTSRLGANTHLGPVEVEYYHSEMSFKNDAGKVLTESYKEVWGSEAGMYELGLIPDLRSATDTVRLHSSYTGKLFAGATMSWTESENLDSKAAQDYFTGQAEIVFMPEVFLTFFVKYRSDDVESETPDTVTVRETTGLDRNVYQVRPPLSYETESLSGGMRLRASEGVTLNAGYEHSSVERENADAWKLASVTVKDATSLSADVTAVENVKLTLKHSQEQVDVVAFNTEPEEVKTNMVAASWTPVPLVSAYASYEMSEGSGSSLGYMDGGRRVYAGEMKDDSNKLFGMISVPLSRKVMLNTFYARTERDADQGLIYDKFDGGYVLDSGARYKDTARNYSANLVYMPGGSSNFGLGWSLIETEASFTPGRTDALRPESIGAFSEVEYRQTEYNLSGGYDLTDDLDAEAKYIYRDLDDLSERPYDSNSRDGMEHAFVLNITKRWQ